MTQRERVLRHFNEFGSLTSLTAFKDYGITRLAAIICRLRKDGYVIDTEDMRSVNRYGETTVFAKYVYKGRLAKK